MEPCITLSILTASAVTPSTFLAFIRSIQAWGKVFSCPNSKPIFFILNMVGKLIIIVSGIVLIMEAQVKKIFLVTKRCWDNLKTCCLK